MAGRERASGRRDGRLRARRAGEHGGRPARVAGARALGAGRRRVRRGGRGARRARRRATRSPGSASWSAAASSSCWRSRWSSRCCGVRRAPWPRRCGSHEERDGPSAIVALGRGRLGVAIVVVDADRPRRGSERRARTCRAALIPAYVPPHELAALARRARRPRMVVVNPDSGPGPRGGAGLPRGGAHAAGGGHPRARLCADALRGRPLADVLADVRRYLAWYGVDGIFFDEASLGCGAAALLPRARAPVRAGARPAGRLNPGVLPAAGYFDVADVVVTFEGTYAGYAGAMAASPDWLRRMPSDRVAHLVYDATRAEALDAVRHPQAGYVYVTSGAHAQPVAQPAAVPARGGARAGDVRVSAAIVMRGGRSRRPRGLLLILARGAGRQQRRAARCADLRVSRPRARERRPRAPAVRMPAPAIRPAPIEPSPSRAAPPPSPFIAPGDRAECRRDSSPPSSDDPRPRAPPRRLRHRLRQAAGARRRAAVGDRRPRHAPSAAEPPISLPRKELMMNERSSRRRP